jgi:hypothetical protein
MGGLKSDESLGFNHTRFSIKNQWVLNVKMADSAPPVLVWFRQDLRLSDNPALASPENRGKIIPVYILDDQAAGQWALGVRHAGGCIMRCRISAIRWQSAVRN